MNWLSKLNFLKKHPKRIHFLPNPLTEQTLLIPLPRRPLQRQGVLPAQLPRHQPSLAALPHLHHQNQNYLIAAPPRIQIQAAKKLSLIPLSLVMRMVVLMILIPLKISQPTTPRPLLWFLSGDRECWNLWRLLLHPLILLFAANPKTLILTNVKLTRESNNGEKWDRDSLCDA